MPVLDGQRRKIASEGHERVNLVRIVENSREASDELMRLVEDCDPPRFIFGLGPEAMQDQARRIAKTSMKLDERCAIGRLSLGSRLDSLGKPAIHLRQKLLPRHRQPIASVTRLALDRRHCGRDRVDVLTRRPGPANAPLIMTGGARRIVVHRPDAIARMAPRIAWKPLASEQLPSLGHCSLIVSSSRRSVASRRVRRTRPCRRPARLTSELRQAVDCGANLLASA